MGIAQRERSLVHAKRDVVTAMDERTEEIYRRARELTSDEHRERHEAEHAAWVEQHEAELLDAETDALLAPQEKTQAARMVYKTYSPPQETSTAAWDNRVRGHIRASLADFADILGGECGALERRLLDRIEKLESETAALRVEAEFLRAHKASADIVALDQKGLRGRVG